MRIFGLGIIIYVVFALLWTLLPSPYYYRKTEGVRKFFENSGTVLLQPVMDVFADGFISHYWDWKVADYKYEDIEDRVLVIESETNFRKIDRPGATFRSVFADIGFVRTVIVLDIEDEASWTLGYCNKNGECFEGSNYASGPKRVLHDGTGFFYGITADEKIVEVNLLRIQDRTKDEEILFI